MTLKPLPHFAQDLEPIYAAASRLTKPNLGVLLQVYLARRAALEAQRTELRRKQQALAQEGFDAAVRLLVGSNARFRLERAPYFERIQDRTRKPHRS